ncbi:DNA helicase RecQ [Persicobacter sp. CCB-QB2]|uniref:DNA helicase RecQ n=1 Tax=Persicobacter sp. CCB-QB2 TaxID=1561025 RepID=UPI0020A0BBC6|nr:DNA helicase RecQ [Persicobacter sp. CCB-QB2]
MNSRVGALMQNAGIVLSQYFGYESFRPLQEDIIQTVLQGEDAMVLMPTGGGKSLCFQIPAIVMEGTCIVISPLIALMEDQVEGLKRNGVAAACLHRGVPYQEQMQIEEDARSGRLHLLYISPEKLLSQNFFEFLKRIRINLFAIDEAHCISFWGHDFRKEYSKLFALRRNFPSVPIIALTATADKLTRRDIIHQLQIPEAKSFISSFDRPNIFLQVVPAEDRNKQLIKFLSQRPNEAGIIYCLSRKSTEDLAYRLRKEGFIARPYHAEIPHSERNKTQEDFLKDKVQIVVATIAFGMGIDKSNVRWVVHYNLPKNIESYYQEIGRGGRDGLNAHALLFYTYADVIRQQQMLKELEEDRRALQEMKLERLKHFTEAHICRRKVLLNYFGEDLKEDCGQCDVCKNPPKSVDGTVTAQKILSAVYRCQQQATAQDVVDILRGHITSSIQKNGWDQLKTFGIGQEIPIPHWHSYIHQMVNMGYMDIALEDQFRLRLTEKSQAVLFAKETVLLQHRAMQKVQVKQEKPKNKAINEALFDALRLLRRQLAEQHDLPPYLIFSDRSLLDMVRQQPQTEDELLKISGVGSKKLDQFGDAFLSKIRSFGTGEMKKAKTTNTKLQTWESFKNGLQPEEIALSRGLNVVTIYSHLADLYAIGYEIPLEKYFSPQEMHMAAQAFRALGFEVTIRQVFDYLKGTVDFHKIRLAKAYLQKNGLDKALELSESELNQL